MPNRENETSLVPAVKPVALCGERYYECRCGLDYGHEGPHVCHDPDVNNELRPCLGSWGGGRIYEWPGVEGRRHQDPCPPEGFPMDGPVPDMSIGMMLGRIGIGMFGGDHDDW